MRQGQVRSELSDVIGGGTLSFDLAPGHPFEQPVTQLLDRVRKDVNDLWAQVNAWNREHAVGDDVDDALRFRVWFYFGQNVERSGDGESRSEG